MHLTATTSTTTGAAGNSDPKDAESTLDMSGRAGCASSPVRRSNTPGRR
ncbi:hypothetical protein G9U53_20545 [Rhodococcus sp. D-46]|nr:MULTISPECIES: hypothetical protein [Rhodococcus]NHE66707.1 hypothetical protein [Rhodococcus sp. D-46]MCT6730754.1 hypothetical protein [Rhodococcus qingshengii]MCZ9630492.1 hypothetical protein [Rhodococcus sp. BH5]MDJ0430377.1 hypothetical protein [Rhodococcus qingshengii]WCT01212.1 hypothetical protein PI247_21150 [Rhodococcus qingshengii]